MTLVDDIKELKKRGYIGLDKHMVKVYESILFYFKKFGTKINRAQQTYNLDFDLNCRQAEEAKQDLFVYLSDKFMIPEKERHLIKPPNTLKNEGERQYYIKWRFYQIFLENYMNNHALPIIYAFSNSVRSNRKRGENTVKITKPKSAARKAPIIKERKKLLDAGVTDEKVILKLLVKKFKLLVKKFSKRPYHYIQQTNLAEKKKEAAKRRLARTGF